MKKIKLYLDCDGVLLNTASPDIYERLVSMGIDTQEKMRDYFIELDWEEFIRERGEIADSSLKIKKLMDKFDVEILTHVNSKSEGDSKKKYFSSKLPSINVIAVPKHIEKADFVNPKGAILVDDYLHNLDKWHEKGGISVKFSDSGKKNSYITICDLLDLLEIDFKVKQRIR